MNTTQVLDQMSDGGIPSENVLLASFLLSVYIAYNTRKNGLETERERERYLNFRYESATFYSDVWGVTIDNILVHENSGLFYRFKKFWTGRTSGSVTVVVRYEGVVIPEDFWESEQGETLLEYDGTEVEHLGTDTHIDPGVGRFEFDTIEPDAIGDYFTMLISIEEKMRPNQ